MYKSKIKNSKQRNTRDNRKREMVYPDDDGQEYAIVQSMLGNGRAKVVCENKSTPIGRICGSMRNHRAKTIIESGDLVLISSREYDKTKVDIIHKYTNDETHFLISNEYLTEYLTRVYNTKHDINFTNDNAPDTTVNEDYIMFSTIMDDIDKETEENNQNNEEQNIDIDIDNI
jgi:initiation factor 1A